MLLSFIQSLSINIFLKNNLFMVGVYFKGRLGNQLFQYTYFLFLKSKFKKGIFFFPNPHHAYITKYFDLGLFHNFILGSKLFSIITRIIPKVVKFKPVYFRNISTPVVKPYESLTMHYGYFQTDWYLKQIGKPINLPIRKKYVQQFEDVLGDVFKNHKTIVVHIRRTDYLHFHNRDITLPATYFQERLAEIADINEYKVIFVSDDVQFVKDNFPIKENYIFSNNNEIVDFQIILNADIAIISNSSFSWWAAYLSNKVKTVYAPKNWMAFRQGVEYPRGIMTDKFIWCDVK